MLMQSSVIGVIQSGDVVKMDKQLYRSPLISKDMPGAKFGGDTLKVWLNGKVMGGGTKEEERSEGRREKIRADKIKGRREERSHLALILEAPQITGLL